MKWNRTVVVVVLALVAIFYAATGATQAVGDDGCVQTPSNATCANHTMPSAMVQEGIQHLCDEMPTMPGCTVQRLCTDEAKKVGASPYCNEFSILKGKFTTQICSGRFPKVSL